MEVAPPEDARDCLVALAGPRNLAEIFSYRFEGGRDLEDHVVQHRQRGALGPFSMNPPGPRS